MGHWNGILARLGGNLNNNFQKSQMPGGLPGGGGMLKLRFDRYIMVFMNMLVSVSCLGFQVFMAFIIPLPPNSILVDPIHCMLSKFSQALRLVKLTSIHEYYPQR